MSFIIKELGTQAYSLSSIVKERILKQFTQSFIVYFVSKKKIDFILEFSKELILIWSIKNSLLISIKFPFSINS